jgi:hypothetical protein
VTVAGIAVELKLGRHADTFRLNAMHPPAALAVLRAALA